MQEPTFTRAEQRVFAYSMRGAKLRIYFITHKLLCWFSRKTNAKAVYLQCQLSLKALRGKEAGRHLYIIRRNCTLWFWRSENFATSSVCQEQGNGNALWGVLYTFSISGRRLKLSVAYVVHIPTLTWGFRRCSFRHTGQCEGLLNVERVTEPAPRFYCAYE